MRLFKWLDRVRLFFVFSIEPKIVFDDDDEPTEPIPELPQAVVKCSTDSTDVAAEVAPVPPR